MNKNQDILKKYFEVQIKKIPARNGLMLLPLRIETRFAENRKVIVRNQPDSVLFIFMELWQMADEGVSIEKMQRILRMMEDFDVVYAQDCRYLKEIIESIPDSLGKSDQKEKDKELRSLKEEMWAVVERYSNTTRTKPNRATLFADRVKRVCRRINEVNAARTFSGKARNKGDKAFSSTVRCRRMKKHVDDARKFLEGIYEEIKEIPYFSKDQADCIYRDVEHIRELSQRIHLIKGKKVERLYPYMAEAYQRDSLLTGNKRAEKPLKEFLESTRKISYFFDSFDLDKLRTVLSRNVRPGYRYTYPATVLIKNRFWDTDESSVYSNDFLEVLKATYFDYHQEMEWLRDIVDINHKDLLKEGGKFRYIKKRKIQYERTAEKCLLVRFYPDTLAITQAQQPLTREEAIEGKKMADYLKKYLDLKKYPKNFNMLKSNTFPWNELRGKWRLMCQTYGAVRSAWIVAQASAPNFNPSDYKEEGNEGFQNVTPVTRMLPERFVLNARLKLDARRSHDFSFIGRRLPEELQVGFNMFEMGKSGDDIYDKTDEGRLKLNKGLAWMTDFDEAERIGMAMTIPLDEMKHRRKTYRENKDKNNCGKEMLRTYEFEHIIVSGVIDDDNKGTKSKKELKDMLTSYLYEDGGLKFLKTGTPTNILTEDDQSDYDTSETRMMDKSFDFVSDHLTYPLKVRQIKDGKGIVITVGPNSKNNSNKSDSFRLNALFGFDNATSPLTYAADSDNMEIHKAEVVSAAVRGKIDDRLSDLREKLTGDGNSDGLLARGYYPVVRVGKQPFGVLPVMDIRRYRMCDLTSYYDQYKQRDRYLDFESWDQIYRDINYVTNWNFLSEKTLTGITGDAYQRYMKVMSMTPTSTTFQKRQVLTMENTKAGEYGETVEVPVNGDAGVESLEGKDNKLVAVCEEIKNFPRVKALNISDDELFDLVAECVDVRTYRLDASFTKMAHSMIRNGADYILGAYGWVLDLKEDKAEPISDEYIIAPSITHAKTAAVLRSAYAKSQRGDSHKDVDNNTLAINLSARRVRIAKRIIDGVKSGLAIGAILGADLERSIHEEMLDVCILPLRKKFTLLSSRLNTDGSTATSSNLNTGNAKEDSKNYALAVINGTKLINALNEIKIKGDVDNILTLRQYFMRNDKEWQAFVNGIDGLRQTLNGKKRDMLKKLVMDMADSYDALTDVVMSESIYKLCEGNTAAVDAIMKSMNNETNFPTPEFVEQPMSCARIEQRVVVGLDASAYVEKAACSGSVFQYADPAVDGWLTGLLSSMSIVKDKVMPASAIVYMSQNMNGLQALLDHKYDEVLSEYQLMLNALREMIGNAHPLRHDELEHTSAGDCVSDPDIKELSSRVGKVASMVEDVLEKVHEIVGDAGPNDDEYYTPTEDIVVALKHLASLGNHSASKLLENPEDVTCDDVRQIVGTLREAVASAKTVSPSSTAEDCQKAIRDMLCNEVMVVPRFSLDTEHLDTKGLAYQLNKDRQFFKNVNPETYDEYVEQVARVRKQVSLLHQVNLFAFFNDGTDLDMKAMQMPVDGMENQQWIGVEVDEDKVCDANSYIIVNSCDFANDLRSGNYAAGLVVDFWTESIPLKEQTAAITFSYDQPDAEAPQTIIYAVNPRVRWGNRWNYQELAGALKSTLELVKLRALEPDDLLRNRWASKELLS